MSTLKDLANIFLTRAHQCTHLATLSNNQLNQVEMNKEGSEEGAIRNRFNEKDSF